VTAEWWSRYWAIWIAAFFLTWLVSELASIAMAHWRGDKHIAEWTLSDTIRRWSSARRWLAPVAVGITAFLLMHLFGIANA